MLKKIGRFFEEHIEKIILVIVGMLCVMLFIWRVLLSPNMVEIVNNEGKTEKLSPVNIDDRVYQVLRKAARHDTQMVKTVLNQSVEEFP